MTLFITSSLLGKTYGSQLQIQEGGCLHLVLVAQRCSCKWLVSKDSLKESGWLFPFCHGITKSLLHHFWEHPKAQKILHVGNQLLVWDDEVKGYAWEGVGCPHDEIKGYVWEGITLWNWSLEEIWMGEGNFH